MGLIVTAVGFIVVFGSMVIGMVVMAKKLINLVRRANRYSEED